jgi:organic hydroperoxide reductase OsmC/OhrA
MPEPRPRVFTFSVDLDEAGAATSDRGGSPLAVDPQAWTPEHLVLVALSRCVLTSLGHHARRAGTEVTSRASASGTVTRREEDGRFAFVEISVAIDVTLSPEPDAEGVRELLAKAERDCFVGASLRVKPAYAWTVGGQVLA